MFKTGVADALGHYVYRLIDPRNAETFYVGKCHGDRVFMHVARKVATDGDILSPKLQRIDQIQKAGLEVEQIIHRHGLDEQTAFEVEAALIDAYPSLEKAVRGKHSRMRGAEGVREINDRYQAEEALWHHNMLLVGVNRTIEQRGVYEASRFAWRLNQKRLLDIEFVVAVANGVIAEVIQPIRWLRGTLENFPDAPHAMEDRWGLVGGVAPEGVRDCHQRSALVGVEIAAVARSRAFVPDQRIVDAGPVDVAAHHLVGAVIFGDHVHSVIGEAGVGRRAGIAIEPPDRIVDQLARAVGMRVARQEVLARIGKGVAARTGQIAARIVAERDSARLRILVEAVRRIVAIGVRQLVEGVAVVRLRRLRDLACRIIGKAARVIAIAARDIGDQRAQPPDRIECHRLCGAVGEGDGTGVAGAVVIPRRERSAAILA